MPKNRYVLGCFDTVEKVSDVIKDLKSKGLTNKDITLVTRADYVPQYADQTEVTIQTEEDVVEGSLWDKITNALSVESRTEKRPDPDYRTDDDPLYGYQDELNSGCIVVMVNGAKWHPNQTEEPEKTEPVNNEEAIMDATDAMNPNVITSTSKGAVMDSGIVEDDNE